MQLKLKNRYDDEKVCDNPDKGWYVHYYDNGIKKYGSELAEDDFLEDFPLMDHIYLRLAWSYLEPEEGKFNWEIIDKIIDPWVAHGKKISFRISCKETGRDQCYATPKWVFDAGCGGEMINGTMQPDFGDPLFLNKLDHFLEAFAARYDSREEVIYLDIGSYGDFGEGHNCCSNRKDWSFDTIKQHIDLHVKHFKHTQLVISDDIVGSRTDTSCNDQLLNYIIDHNISIRDDGICVDWFTQRFGYNTLRSGPIFDRAWRTMPTVLELEHYHLSLEDGNYRNGWPFLASVQESHATYAGFHGYPRKWLRENPEMAVMLGNALGYWYFLYAVDFPDTITDASFPITCYWENKGAAVAYKAYHLAFKLSQGDQEYVYEVPEFNNKEMMPHTITVRPLNLKFNAPKGTYRLSCRMYNDEGRTIEIGMQNQYCRDDGFYDITELTIQ